MNETFSRFGLPPDISTHGYGIDRLIDFLHYFMVVLFVAWGIFMVYCLIRYRQRPGHTATYQPVKGTLPKFGEVFVVIIEAVLLIGFTMPVWADLKDSAKSPSEDEALLVRVVAQQFAWNVHYAGADGVFGPTDLKLVDETENPIGLDRSHADAKDDIVALNQMHAPVDKPVIVRLTSKDVIHSFWIPMLRVKQDVVPGMEIPIWFQATHTTEEVRAHMARLVQVAPEGSGDESFIKAMSSQRLMKAYATLAAGDYIDEETLPVLRQAGITEIEIGPADPIEIQCAQLCGMNHFSMRGFFTVETQEEFDAWLEGQAAFLGDEDDDWEDDEDEE